MLYGFVENGRLAFYEVNSFPVPTTGRGPFLLQSGVTGAPMVAGGVLGCPARLALGQDAGQDATSVLPGLPASIQVDPSLALLGIGVFAVWAALVGVGQTCVSCVSCFRKRTNESLPENSLTGWNRSHCAARLVPSLHHQRPLSKQYSD